MSDVYKSKQVSHSVIKYAKDLSKEIIRLLLIIYRIKLKV